MPLVKTYSIHRLGRRSKKAMGHKYPDGMSSISIRLHIPIRVEEKKGVYLEHFTDALLMSALISILTFLQITMSRLPSPFRSYDTMTVINFQKIFNISCIQWTCQFNMTV